MYKKRWNKQQKRYQLIFIKGNDRQIYKSYSKAKPNLRVEKIYE